MNTLVYYNIPVRLLSAYQQEHLIVRTDQPALLPAALEAEDPERIAGAQIVALNADSEPLNAWAPGLPLELILRDPVAEFPLLYRHANLLDNHPARVIVPVAPGFGKAVKAALALDFAVRLEVGQPEPALVEEMATVLEFYLHQSTVAQPIEYFHGSLQGFFHDEPVSLWVLQDDDPQYVRYVTDEGVEQPSRRLANLSASIALDAGLEAWIARVLAVEEECQNCEFLKSCGGYFKWPRRDYDCVGVKQLFGLLRDAAVELRRDLEVGPP